MSNDPFRCILSQWNEGGKDQLSLIASLSMTVIELRGGALDCLPLTVKTVVHFWQRLRLGSSMQLVYGSTESTCSNSLEHKVILPTRG